MYKIKIIVFLIILVPQITIAATLIFKSGFEGGDIQVEDPITPTTAQWDDCGGATCLNNPSYCNDGCNDSVTNYNMPADLPGEYRVLGTNVPHFNLIYNGDVYDGGVTTADAKNGSRSLRLWVDEDASWLARWQLNLRSTGSGETYDNFNTRTCQRHWVKHTDLPDASETYFLFEEWIGGTNRLMIVWDSGESKPVWRYMYNTSNCNTPYSGSGDYGCVYNKTINIPENEWFQIISYHETGNSARVVLKIKRTGQSEQTIFDLTLDNNDGGNTNFWNPIKYYGSSEGYWVYWDDLSIFSSTGASDLPAWDSDAVTPTVTVAATDAIATEEGTTTGTWTISCSPDCAGETINYEFGGTATLDVDYNCDDEDGNITITGSSVTIVLTPVDDDIVDVGENASLTITSGSGYAVGSPSIDSISIEDNDGAQDQGISGITVDASGSGEITYSNSGSGSWSR